jgi:arginyl-tRNA synthetase
METRARRSVEGFFKMKSIIVQLLSKALSDALPQSEIVRLIEVPPTDDMGDFAFPCFPLARALKKNPKQIAEQLCESLVLPPEIQQVKAISGYLNFYVNKKILAGNVLNAAFDNAFGEQHREKSIVVEFASPNTNKPLHLGHLRNMSIGESIARILQFGGNRVVRTSINNDRGVHICKSMLAYSEFGNGATPEATGKKSDHFVGDYYVMFSKKATEDESWNERAQEMLRRWESGDEATLALWKTMNGWALGGFRETYNLFGIKFDKEYYESAIYKSGKEIVQEGLSSGIFTLRSDGAAIVNLESEKLGEKVLLRPDGTSVYIVQDLYLAVIKNQEYNYDQSIYVVGNEQDYHFAVLIAIFKKLGNPISERMKHLSYGMVELPEGRMKSREGTVVDADDLIHETARLASDELKERYKLSEDERADRSLKIALSAIKYQLLKVDITKSMLFDPKKAISFEGDTGPYLLYSYARAASILRKADAPETFTIPECSQQEVRIIKKIAAFPDAVNSSLDKLSPSIIANYAFELSQNFNEFYHFSKVIGSDVQDFRLQIVKAFKMVLKKCLWLLSIEEIEEM